MSKASRPRDLREHAHETGLFRRQGWCKGCGLYHATHGEHRLDCLTLPAGCPECLYWPNVHAGAHRPDCSRRPS